MILQKTTKRYFFNDKDELLHVIKTAEISFFKKNYYWEFEEVKYTLSSNSHYTEEDWKFLGEIAQKIVDLKKELNK